MTCNEVVSLFLLAVDKLQRHPVHEDLQQLLGHAAGLQHDLLRPKEDKRLGRCNAGHVCKS